MTAINENKETAKGAKRPLKDAVLLWLTGCLVVAIGLSFFWLTDQLNFKAPLPKQ